MKRLSFGLALAMFVVAALAVSLVPESYAAVHDLTATSLQLVSGGFDPISLGVFGGLVTSKVMRDLQAKKVAATKEARALQDKASAEDRDLTEEESKTFEGHAAQIGKLNAAIEREALLIAEEAAAPASAAPAGSGARVDENIENDGKRGFRSSGEFFKALIQAGARNGDIDQRLTIGAAAPTSFGGEGVGADGGFAVPPDFAREIFTHSLGEDSLLPLTDGVTIGGNSMVFPKDETTPWGTDGIRAYWQAEAQAGIVTKPKLSNSTLRLYKLMALIPLSDEMIEDTDALGSYLPKKVGDSIRWKTNEAILFGTGAGQPLGAFNGNAVVTVAKEGGQATLTLQPLNIAKMIMRMPAGSYGRCVWMINNDVIPALYTLALGNYPIYMPISAGLQTSPYGTLSGRPIMVTQHAKSFTNQGDVLLLDPQYVRSITKATGLQTATSMHIYFDADATAFRTTFRVDAQPKIVNPIAPFNGANNLSPFVQLGAR